MKKIVKSITELVGNTPMLELVNYNKKYNLKATLFGKLEYFNPAGSIKDRTALNMLQKAIEEGKIKPGDTFVDSSSGNTGIALAAYAAALGYKFICFIEPGVSIERLKMLKAYGAILKEFTEIPELKEAIEKGAFTQPIALAAVRKFSEENGYFFINQVENEHNPEMHYITTGPEIWEQTEGKVDIVVALAGTAGTILGTSKFLKEKNPNIKFVAVEPSLDSMPSAENPKPDMIEGVIPILGWPEELRTAFFRKYDVNQFDEYITVSSKEAYATGRDFAAIEGVFLGASAGAALTAARQVAEREENSGKNIVVIMADNGMKYLSTNMYKYD